MAAVTSPARHAASLATSASSREPRRSKVHRAMEWLKPSSAPSSVTMSASVPARMQTPSCTSYRLGSLTTTRFTRTRHSDIVHPVSSSQLTETRDCVRSFGGYNSSVTMEDTMCWEIDYKFFAEQKKAQQTRIEQERRAGVIHQLLNEASKQGEPSNVEGTPAKETAPAK